MQARFSIWQPSLKRQYLLPLLDIGSPMYACTRYLPYLSCSSICLAVQFQAGSLSRFGNSLRTTSFEG